MEQLVDIVGVNIREIRKQKKLTQEELAEKCGLQTSYLAGVERGVRNITLQTLEKIALGLEINAKELFELESPLIKLALEKQQLLQIFTSYMQDKSEKEIQLLINIANNIFETYK
ncbi:helix-turn-helix domain-containing protein [Lysinibacillus capsici]|uniref:helix-turn-helix domain-containing protein n=1 Tax=Lysinibacillus capsici TaxID=2115968 RepID=UPI001C114B24|nr:helix-turn-helix transcriptional regulator [Lysinibacillus capsici]MBU5253114.1 helix-turn-helix domain-containing protein [Lysinibacillus capsici]